MSAKSPLTFSQVNNEVNSGSSDAIPDERGAIESVSLSAANATLPLLEAIES